MDEDKLKMSTTTDGSLPWPGLENAGAPAPIDKKTGQHEAYWVLKPEERAKGFVRPVRRSYVHERCGGVTTMGIAIAETSRRMEFERRELTCSKCGELFYGSVPVGTFYEVACWVCNCKSLASQVSPLVELEMIRAQNYRITITIEATAPAAAHGYCGKGSTVAEAVRSLGEMMNKAEGRT